jgi:hypothetical protein
VRIGSVAYPAWRGAVTYNSERSKFPPGNVQGPFLEAGVTEPVTHGWAPYVLPFIERQQLVDLYRWDQNMYDPLNQPVVATQLPISQCPWAPEQNRFMTFGAFSWGGRGACGDYASAFSVDPILVGRGWIDRPANLDGVLAPNHMTRLSEITDGTSNSILLTEVAGRPRQWRAGTRCPRLAALSVHQQPGRPRGGYAL